LQKHFGTEQHKPKLRAEPVIGNVRLPGMTPPQQLPKKVTGVIGTGWKSQPPTYSAEIFENAYPVYSKYT
jgi:hypothetical protein